MNLSGETLIRGRLFGEGVRWQVPVAAEHLLISFIKWNVLLIAWPEGFQP